MTKGELLLEVTMRYVQLGKQGYSMEAAFQRIIDIVADYEIEACAKVCEAKALKWDEKSPIDGTVSHWLRKAADEICSRSNAKDQATAEGGSPGAHS